MNCSEAQKVDIVDFLQKQSYEGVQKGRHFWFRSPLRNEKTASFSVDPAANRWIDFATGESGDIIDLVKLLYNVDTSGALQVLSGEIITNQPDPGRIENYNLKKQTGPVITEVMPLQSKSCIWYLKSRKIKIDIAKLYTNEVYYTINGNAFYSVGMANDNGGWAIRNKYFKGCLSPNGITTIKGNKPGVLALIEGFISFLSLLVYYKVERLNNDVIILNSLVNLDGLLPLLNQYQQIHSWLDNDASGRKARDVITEVHPNVVDMSKAIYPGYKDMNEYLMG